MTYVQPYSIALVTHDHKRLVVAAKSEASGAFPAQRACTCNANHLSSLGYHDSSFAGVGLIIELQIDLVVVVRFAGTNYKSVDRIVTLPNVA